MNKQVRRGLLLLTLLAAAGCGDSSETLLRTGVNIKSELTDRVMKVDDEQTARKFFDYYIKIYNDRIKDLDEKWLKWVKDIEDDFRKDKVRVVTFKSSGNPGDEQWLKDAEENVPSKKAAEASAESAQRLTKTRADFVLYMKKINADKERLKREMERLEILVKQRVADKVNEEMTKGVEHPNVDPKLLCPSLVKMTDPANFKGQLLNGAEKRVP